ncbi:MAG TPA: energy transducer TonB [Chthoniobacterales bacterium]
MNASPELQDPASPRLIFATSPRNQHEWLLPVMLLFSILFHAFTFYLVQANYPVSSKTPPPSARLTILNPADPHSQALTRWIERRDPAAIVRDSNPIEPPESLTNVPYQAAYEQLRPQLHQLMEESGPQRLATVSPPGVVRSYSRKSSPEFRSTPDTRSEFRFIDGLALAPGSQDSFDPPKAGTTTPGPAVFLIAVDANGQLQHAFLQHSSGSEALDRYASQWLRRARFSASTHAEKWGHVAILWGSEVFP